MKKQPPPKVELREVTTEDLPILFEHQRDPEANRLAAFPPRDQAAFAAHWNNILADETVPAKSVLLEGRVVGSILSWVHEGRRLVGYWIGREHWGKGVATLALCEYLRVVTDRPLYAHVAKHNVASVRVLEKCGFALDEAITAALPQPEDGIEEFVFSLPATTRAGR